MQSRSASLAPRRTGRLQLAELIRTKVPCSACPRRRGGEPERPVSPAAFIKPVSPKAGARNRRSGSTKSQRYVAALCAPYAVDERRHGPSLPAGQSTECGLYDDPLRASFIGCACGVQKLTHRETCSTFVLMKNAPESMREGAEPLSQTHHLIAEILLELRPAEMQTVYFQCIEDGPKACWRPSRRSSLSAACHLTL